MELVTIQAKTVELRNAEGTVKSLIAELIVAVTQRIHAFDDIDSANAFLVALSPMNHKKALQFMVQHGGHKIAEGVLGKRLKDYMSDGVKVTPYLTAKDTFEKFADSGMNFWQWAVTKIKKVEKDVTLDDLVKQAKKARDALAEGIEAGVIDKVTAFEMLTGGVFSQDDMMNILQVMARAEAAVGNIRPRPVVA